MINKYVVKVVGKHALVVGGLTAVATVVRDLVKLALAEEKDAR